MAQIGELTKEEITQKLAKLQLLEDKEAKRKAYANWYAKQFYQKNHDTILMKINNKNKKKKIVQKTPKDIEPEEEDE